MKYLNMYGANDLVHGGYYGHILRISLESVYVQSENDMDSMGRK